MLGTLFYNFLCRQLTLRWLPMICVGGSALGTFGYPFYRSGSAAAIVEYENGLLAMLAVLSLIDLGARATPRGREGLGFALMMSVQNGALAHSDASRSWLIDRHYVTSFNLVWLNAGTTALILLVIPFLPWVLVDRPDDVR